MTRIYTDEILRHDRDPQNWGRLEHPTHQALGTNPICGDQIHVSVVLVGDVISQIGIDGNGCALCRASASMMSVFLSVRAVGEAELAKQALTELLEGAPADRERLGPLVAFDVVHPRPTRWKCVTLPWSALSAALSAPAGSPDVEFNTWAERKRSR